MHKMEGIWKVGVRPNKGLDGLVNQEDIEKTITEVMARLNSEEIENSVSWRQHAISVVSKGESSETNFNKFLSTLHENEAQMKYLL